MAMLMPMMVHGRWWNRRIFEVCGRSMALAIGQKAYANVCCVSLGAA
jgi:hypothetical protein